MLRVDFLYPGIMKQPHQQTVITKLQLFQVRKKKHGRSQRVAKWVDAHKSLEC